jgi:ubiquinone/menaquinone biosynthesis C-methylase UbiE
MGFYTDHILPRLLDLTMGTKRFTQLRRETLAQAKGVVLEIGCGSGLNFLIYPPAVTHLIALDPSSAALQMARKNAPTHISSIEFLEGSSERIPLPDGSVDHVVSTWTLCTIPNPQAALAEILRVLKPGGKLLFLEHGLSPDKGVAKWQHRLTPFQKKFVGGCYLNRPIGQLILEAGFQMESVRNFYMEGPKVMTYLYRGAAVKER